MKDQIIKIVKARAEDRPITKNPRELAYLLDTLHWLPRADLTAIAESDRPENVVWRILQRDKVSLVARYGLNRLYRDLTKPELPNRVPAKRDSLLGPMPEMGAWEFLNTLIDTKPGALEIMTHFLEKGCYTPAVVGVGKVKCPPDALIALFDAFKVLAYKGSEAYKQIHPKDFPLDELPIYLWADWDKYKLLDANVEEAKEILSEQYGLTQHTSLVSPLSVTGEITQMSDGKTKFTFPYRPVNMLL